MQSSKIKSVISVGIKKTVDLEVDHPDHNFFCNGICISNSHATGYASLSALCVYLKFKYPQDFFVALLNQAKNEPKPLEEITKIQAELKYFGIKLLPPNLMKSSFDFVKEGRDIRFGLASIKGVSDKTLTKLMQFKNEYSNKFEVFEAANNAKISINVLSALIQSGCMDSVRTEGVLKTSRARMTAEAQYWNVLNVKEKKQALIHGKQFDYELFNTMEHVRTLKDDKGKLVISESRAETIRKHFGPFKEIYDLNRQTSLANFFYEKMLLGYNYSIKLGDVFPHEKLQNIIDAKNAEDREGVSFAGWVAEDPVEGISKNERKTRWARFTISDETGSINAMMFNEDIDNLKNSGAFPKKDSIVICHGTKKGDSVFLSDILEQNHRIYTKYKDIGVKVEKTLDNPQVLD